jgi:hypothetical protein
MAGTDVWPPTIDSDNDRNDEDQGEAAANKSPG